MMNNILELAKNYYCLTDYAHKLTMFVFIEILNKGMM